MGQNRVPKKPIGKRKNRVKPASLKISFLNPQPNHKSALECFVEVLIGEDKSSLWSKNEKPEPWTGLID